MIGSIKQKSLNIIIQATILTFSELLQSIYQINREPETLILL